MAIAFAKLFKKRSNKENNEPSTLIRGKANGSSMRCKSIDTDSVAGSSVTSGVYIGDYSNHGDSAHSLPRNQRTMNAGAGAFHEIPFMSTAQSYYKFKSPYSVVTEPKTKKSVRSCPGGPTYSSLRGSYHLQLPPRHFSPEYRHKGRSDNRYTSTIFEVSGSYENYPSHFQSTRQDAQSLEDEFNIDRCSDDFKEKTEITKTRRAHKQQSSNRSAQPPSFGRSQEMSGSLRDSITSMNHKQQHSRRMPTTNAKALYNSKGQRVLPKTDRSSHARSQRQHNVTSEYGSADPSPTNHLPPASVNSIPPMDFFDDNSFENTDYETDSDDAMPTNMTDLFDQQLRKVSTECNLYREKAKRYKAKYADLRGKYEEANKELLKERRKNQSLNVALINANNEVERFRTFINQQFHNVNSQFQAHQRQQHAQTSHSQPKSRPQSHVPGEWNTVDGSMKLFGAGEALCSRTELLGAADNGATENENVQTQFNLAQPHGREIELACLFAQPPHINSLFAEKTADRLTANEDELDELKTFRQPEGEEDKESSLSYSRLEEARASSVMTDGHLRRTVSSNSYFSQPFQDKAKIGGGELMADDVSVKDLNDEFQNFNKSTPLKEDDGYSTMQQEAKFIENTEQETVHNVLQQSLSNIELQQVHNIANGTLLTSSAQQKTNNIEKDQNNNVVNVRDSKNPSAMRCPPTPPPRRRTSDSAKMVRRSFSDTDLSNVCLIEKKKNVTAESEDDRLAEAEDYDAGGEDYKFEEDSNENQENIGNCMHISTSSGRRVAFRGEDNNTTMKNSLAKKRLPKDRYCHYSSKAHGDYSSSYSSDDDAIRIFSKQLRRRGELIHFRPPRKNIINLEHTFGGRIGPRERQAISEFDYLQEISTDVSGLVSSPDPQ